MNFMLHLFHHNFKNRKDIRSLHGALYAGSWSPGPASPPPSPGSCLQPALAHVPIINVSHLEGTHQAAGSRRSPVASSEWRLSPRSWSPCCWGAGSAEPGWRWPGSQTPLRSRFWPGLPSSHTGRWRTAGCRSSRQRNRRRAGGSQGVSPEHHRL